VGVAVVGAPEGAGVGRLDGIHEGRKVGAGVTEGEEEGMNEMVGLEVAIPKADEFLVPSLEYTTPTASPTPRAMAAKAKTLPAITFRGGILSSEK
jgi:hypothetical protein